MKKKAVCSIEDINMFSPSCKVIELLHGLHEAGFAVELHVGKWATDSGLSYDRKTASYVKGSSDFLWDPNTHPKDIFENLLLPTFPNLKIYYNNNWFTRNKIRFLSLIKPTYYNAGQIISLFAREEEKVNYFQQKVGHYIYGSNIFVFLYHIISLKWALPLKFRPRSSGLRYRLSEDKYTHEVKDFIENAKNDAAFYVLVTANWDDQQVFEPQNDRIRGINYDPLQFYDMKRLVEELDCLAEENNYRILLASKKAVDWPQILTTEFLDMRNFESLGFSLSQTIFIMQELCLISINWPNTMTLWITNCKNIFHLNWSDAKETSEWARTNGFGLKAKQVLKYISDIETNN